jgi:hypothetical protein
MTSFLLTIVKVNLRKKSAKCKPKTPSEEALGQLKVKTRPAWAGFKTAEEGRANTPFGVGEPCGSRG